MIPTIIFLILMLVAPLAAQGSSTSGFIPLNPLAGAYFDPDTSGTGWFISVGLKGEVFAAHFTYGTDGKPTWVVLDSTFQPAADFDRVTTGVIGQVSGQLYVGESGQYVGGAKKPATISGSPLGPATLVWTNTDRASFTYNGVTTRLIRYHDFQAQSSPSNTIVGTWRWREIRPYSRPDGSIGGKESPRSFIRGVTVTQILDIRPASTRRYFYLDSSVDSEPARFPIDDVSTAEQYELICHAGGCPYGGTDTETHYDYGKSSDTVIVREPSGLFRVITYRPDKTRSESLNGQPITRYATYASRYQYTLYVRSPTANVLVVKENLPQAPTPDYKVFSELTLERIESGILPEEEQQPFGTF